MNIIRSFDPLLKVEVLTLPDVLDRGGALIEQSVMASGYPATDRLSTPNRESRWRSTPWKLKNEDDATGQGSLMEIRRWGTRRKQCLVGEIKVSWTERGQLQGLRAKKGSKYAETVKP